MREEGAGRPRQSQHGPLGKVVGEGEEKPEKTLAGPWPWQPPWKKTSPDPSIMGVGSPGGPRGERCTQRALGCPARKGLPSPGSAEVGGGTRMPVGCGRQNWVQTQPNHFFLDMRP